MRDVECSSEGGWTAAMRAGDFERAWSINDRDLARRTNQRGPKHEGPRHLQHIWRGEPLRNTRVLVRCYHGLGDTIQFIRFAKPLRRIARDVTVWVQPELLNLVKHVDGVDHALPLHDGTPDVSYDVDIEIMELAHALRATPEMISQSVPYLKAPRRSPATRGSLFAPELFHTGLVWRAGDWDTRRSVDLRYLASLATIPEVRLHLLQPTQINERGLAVRADDRWAVDISTVAQTLAQLDLVITVDTMMAHLAGAMGVPVWTMLCHDCDWRWGVSHTTPWYPTMRLFRQQSAGEWEGVVATIADELRAIVRERTEERVG
jgi:hypothetical protein